MTEMKYELRTLDGRTFAGQLGLDIRKTLDKRNRAATHEEPQVVFECRNEAGVFVLVWTDELESINGEPV